MITILLKQAANILNFYLINVNIYIIYKVYIFLRTGLGMIVFNFKNLAF